MITLVIVLAGGMTSVPMETWAACEMAATNLAENNRSVQTMCIDGGYGTVKVYGGRK